MAAVTDKGVIDAADRILAQLLKKPAFKSGIRTVLNNIDPGSSNRLAKTILWEDMEVTMSFLSAVPNIANAAILFSDAMLAQIREKFPPPMFNGFIGEIAGDIDVDGFNRVKQKATQLIDDLMPVLEKALAERPPAPAIAAEDPKPAESEEEVPKTETGIIREVLGTGFIKDIIGETLRSIDPEGGRDMARALFWQDAEVPFSVLAALPDILNLVLTLIDEIGQQLVQKIPPQMLKGYLVNTFSSVDVETVKNAIETYTHMVRGVLDVSPELRGIVLDFIQGPVPSTVVSTAINYSLDYINAIEEESPGTMSTLMSDIISKIDKDAFAKTATTVTHAVLDQKPPVFTIVWQFIKIKWQRLWGKFRKKR